MAEALRIATRPDPQNPGRIIYELRDSQQCIWSKSTNPTAGPLLARLAARTLGREIMEAQS